MYDHCLYISISCNEYKRLSWSYLFQFHLLYIVLIIIICLLFGFSWKNCVIFASGKGHLFCAYSYWYHSSIFMWSSMNSILFYLFFSIYDKCDKVMPILYEIGVSLSPQPNYTRERNLFCINFWKIVSSPRIIWSCK